jgi:hypothetical protein
MCWLNELANRIAGRMANKQVVKKGYKQQRVDKRGVYQPFAAILSLNINEVRPMMMYAGGSGNRISSGPIHMKPLKQAR